MALADCGRVFVFLAPTDGTTRVCVKLQTTRTQKRWARMILKGIDQVQFWIERGNVAEAEFVAKMLKQEMRELLRDIELSNLERWSKL